MENKGFTQFDFDISICFGYRRHDLREHFAFYAKRVQKMLIYFIKINIYTYILWGYEFKKVCKKRNNGNNLGQKLKARGFWCGNFFLLFLIEICFL